MAISDSSQSFRAQKQKTRQALLRRRAEECFVQRTAMHTSSGAACGRDDDGDDAPGLCACVPLRNSKIKEIRARVN